MFNILYYTSTFFFVESWIINGKVIKNKPKNKKNMDKVYVIKHIFVFLHS